MSGFFKQYRTQLLMGVAFLSGMAIFYGLYRYFSDPEIEALKRSIAARRLEALKAAGAGRDSAAPVPPIVVINP